MLWHSIRHLQKKIDYLDEDCPSNRPNQNCDYLLIFYPSIPTAGQAITTKYCYLAYGYKWGMLKMTFTTYPKLFIGV